MKIFVDEKDNLCCSKITIKETDESELENILSLWNKVKPDNLK